MPPDSDLLRQYARQRDEAAFAEVVRRHVNLVHATALRLLNGDAHLAQDVTQAVFAELARQAAKLGGHPTVAGWLHTTARFLASKTVRTERRRRAREQEAIAMTDSLSADPALWEQLRPLLDEAVARLDATDRDALLLRFFEGKSHREVAATLKVNEDAARMRIGRALDKLREQFSRRGVATTAALLGTALGVHGAPAAPAAFAATVAAKSLAAAATSAGVGVWAWFSLRSYVLWVAATVIAVFAAGSFWLHQPTVGPVVSVSRTTTIPAASPSKPTATSLPAAAPSLAALPSPPIALPPPIVPIVPPDSTASPPVIATPPTPADSPAPSPAEDLTASAVARLEAVRAALDRAATNLRSATSATHGGFVSKGRADLAPALAAANAALDFARANPASSVQPATISPASNATLVRLNGVHQPTPNSQPSMHRTLAALKSALEVLQSVPGGDLGGAREIIISSVAQTTNDVIAGIRFADQDATAKFSPPLHFEVVPGNWTGRIVNPKSAQRSLCQRNDVSTVPI